MSPSLPCGSPDPQCDDVWRWAFPVSGIVTTAAPPETPALMSLHAPPGQASASMAPGVTVRASELTGVSKKQALWGPGVLPSATHTCVPRCSAPAKPPLPAAHPASLHTASLDCGPVPLANSPLPIPP